MTYKKIKSKKILNVVLGCLIIFSTLFLGIGYAALSNKILSVDGSVSAEVTDGMFISDVQYVSNVGADLTNSQIIDYTGTMLHSNIALSSTNGSSSITYQVSIFNNSDSLKQFKGISYLDDLYSNSNITYTLSGFNVGDTIDKGVEKTFNITFAYRSTSNLTNNTLESYLNFDFDYYFEEEVDVDVLLNDTDGMEFAGVSEENPIDLNNIAIIHFVVKNGATSIITSLLVDIIYTTPTGSTQSAKIDIMDENHNVIATQTTQFRGKQTNATLTITFSNVNISTGQKMEVSFDQGTVNNGRVNVTGVKIRPVFE